MKTFKILVNPENNAKAVKQGWSWSGFFLTFIWAISNNLIFVSILSVCIIALPAFLDKYFAITLGIPILKGWLLYFLVGIFLGYRGNYMIEEKLIEEGYTFDDTIISENPDAAVALWLKNNKSS